MSRVALRMTPDGIYAGWVSGRNASSDVVIVVCAATSTLSLRVELINVVKAWAT